MNTVTHVTETIGSTPAPWGEVLPNRKVFGAYQIDAIVAHAERLFDNGSAAGVEAVAAMDRANCNLIGAAPDLLEAAQDALDVMVGLLGPKVFTIDTWRKLRDAVAKAEGTTR